MMRLKKILPLLFLLFSVECAVVTAKRTEAIQRKLPGGVLAVTNEEDAEEAFIIVEKEDDSPLYKNGAVEILREKYGIEVSKDEITELDPIKELLSQGWKLYLLSMYFLIMLWVWKKSIGYIVRGYTEFRQQELSKTAGRICFGVSLYLISIAVWYRLLCFVEIPQQYLPTVGIWDVGYFVEEIRDFHKKVQVLGDSVPVFEDVWRAGKAALVGYGLSVLLFLPGWIGMMCRKEDARDHREKNMGV